MAKKRGRPSALSHVSFAELQRELDRRLSQVDELVAERESLLARLEELDSQIAAAGGPAGPGRPRKVSGRRTRSAGRARGTGVGRKRPKNSMSLAEAMQKLLRNKTMSVTEIASAVQKAGYRTNAENFRTIVNQTLIKDDRFKKVARGQYTAA